MPSLNAQRTASALALVLQLGAVTPTGAQEKPFWGKLEAGPFGVGFRTEWLLDYGRVYSSTFHDGSTYATGKAPRPILVNIWYPAPRDAPGPRMEHGGYLAFEPSDSRVATFARALKTYNLAVIAEEITDLGSDERDSVANALLEAVYGAPTAAVRNASAANGRFPIIIYHSGHGSSFEDNSVLCEYLASHGYIVLGSAFQYGDGDGLGTDTDAGSIADVDELIRFARRLPSADWNRIGLIGHSGGAQLALLYASRPGSAVDAFVLLDTTQDYYSLFDNRWRYPADVLKGRSYATSPMLFAANPHAFFVLADSLSEADRYYLTIRDLGHNEFISQGVIASAFANARRLRNDSSPETLTWRFDSDPAVRSAYEALVTNVHRFLAGYLQGDAAALNTLQHGFRDSLIGGRAPHIEYLAKGATSAPPYVDTHLRAPTPRQFRDVLDERGVDSTIALMRRIASADTVTPILNEEIFATALLYELVEVGREPESATLYRFFKEHHPNLIRQFLRWYDFFAPIGDEVTAETWLRIARSLDPDDPEVVKRSGGD